MSLHSYDSHAMIAFLGPAQAVAVAPFCTERGLAAWAATHRAVHATLTADVVWRQVLADHFRSALHVLGHLPEVAQQQEPQQARQQQRQQLLEATGAPSQAPEALVAKLTRDAPRQVYAALRGTSSQPFALEPRARLLLEIHELREWDKHQQQLIVHRQASLLARALGREQASEQLQTLMMPGLLELVSLQAMMGGGGAPRLLEQSGLKWDPSVDAELRQRMERRLQRRRAWWQRQREYLLQDLEWH